MGNGAQYADITMANIASSSKQVFDSSSSSSHAAAHYRNERYANLVVTNRYPTMDNSKSTNATHAAHATTTTTNGFVPSDGAASSASSPTKPNGNAPTTAASLMREGARDFVVIKEVGDGSFGTVCLADWKSPLPSGTLLSPMQHPTTRPEYIGKRLVAIKKMKKPFPNWHECMKLKELKSLLVIPHHPNIIPLYDAFLMPTTKELHFVFECMEGNLYQLTKSRKGRPLAVGLVASIYEQIVQGLDHIHSHGYFHRDMKPENLLITTTGLADYPSSSSTASAATPPEKDVLVIVKLADFGLARETSSAPPYTEYVSTRWYRAPEVLLRSRDYSNPVDMWALGTILAELVNLKPLFPGQSEVDQVLQICQVLGDPSSAYGRDSKGRAIGGGDWEKGIKMSKAVGFQFPKMKPVKFSTLFSSRIPMSLIECIQDLLRYDPKARLTTKDCLQHPYMIQDAFKLRPPQPKPMVSATSPVKRQQPSSAIHMADNEYASKRSLPPSHSNPMSPQQSKPPFGAANTKLRALPSLRQDPTQAPASQLERIPFYAQSNQAAAPISASSSSNTLEVNAASLQPMQEDAAADIQWAPAPGNSQRDSAVSNYPAFPDSASLYAGSHASMQFEEYRSARASGVPVYRGEQLGAGSGVGGGDTVMADISSSSQKQHAINPNNNYQSNPPSQQQGGGMGVRTVYDDELTAAYDRERITRPTLQHANYGQQNKPSSDQLAHSIKSSSEHSYKNDANASTETINSKESSKRRSRGWGLHLPSVFGGSHAGQSNLSILQQSSSLPGGASSSRQSFDQQHQHPPPQQQHHHHHHHHHYEQQQGQGQIQTHAQQTPAQKLAAEHSVSPVSASTTLGKTLLDPKKAKKEAEKAAKEAEKAKREAQQKAARDRARAVMQKRNQILASSNRKDPVEWLSGTMLTDEPYRNMPSEKVRGKQAVQGTTQLSPSMTSFPSGDFTRSPIHASQQMPHPLSPEYGHVVSPSMSSSMAWRGVGGVRYTRSTNPRRRGEYDDNQSLSSFEDAMDPRRASLQSYQTRDSDPGPATGQRNSMHRTNSASSLASAPSLDPRRFTASLDSHHNAQDARSVSSLDHQLITNLENMTAAEARARTPGNGSPAPSHPVSTRQSTSRQSRANSRASSASAHRQGSASPLHHASGISRFHPYSHGGGTAGSNSTGSSYHPTFQLPPLHQSLQQQQQQQQQQSAGRERDSRTTDGSHSSSGLVSAEGMYFPLPAISAQGHVSGSGSGVSNSHSSAGHPHINPIFNVSNLHGNSFPPTTLPPFSQIAAAVDVKDIHHPNSTSSPPPSQHLFYASHSHSHMS